jgi:hypothetical protein
MEDDMNQKAEWWKMKWQVLTHSINRLTASGGAGGKDKWNPLDDGSLDYTSTDVM